MHISFDFWNTIANANPNFSAARDRVLRSMAFNPLCLHEYRQLKTRLDAEAEAGRSPALTQGEVFTELSRLITAGDPSGLLCAFIDEFYNYPPKISPDVVDAITELNMQGHTVSVTSNTNFISGRNIRPILKKAFKDVHWSYMLFSDEVGWSKPHANMWIEVKDLAKDRDIVHVGDNAVCDGSCVEHGIRYLQVGSPSDLPMVLKGIVR